VKVRQYCGQSGRLDRVLGYRRH